MRNLYILVLLSGILYSCKSEKKALEEFIVNEILLSQSEYPIDNDYLARIEGIQCNDSSLIILDFHSGYSYTLFNLESGNYKGRFGEIGQGPNEIPAGCIGVLADNRFDIHSIQTSWIGSYNMDSLSVNIKTPPISLTRYEFPFDGCHFSKIISINDTIFFAAGFYAPKYQYVLFNHKNEIIDYNVEIYNAWDFGFNNFHRMLSNEGVSLRKRPGKNSFVYFVNNSSNLDFIEIKDNRIIPINLLRKGNPIIKPVQQGTLIRAIPELNCPIGYIDIAAGENYVYALHTDKDITNYYCSDIVYVFDWEGNPIKQYKLDKEAYYLTVNEKLNRLYAAIRKEDGGWDITSYEL